MSRTTRQILFVARPMNRMLNRTDVRVESVSLPDTIPDGSVLLRLLYISVDPYMRPKMTTERSQSYTDPYALNEPLDGGVVAQVEESRNPSLPVGTVVTGFLPWIEHQVHTGAGLEVVDLSQTPPAMLSHLVGALGKITGCTAYVGLVDIGQVRAGETVLVSAAAGAVGHLVGQLAKLRGCRVVGIAGGEAKCRYVVDSCGFDACIDYKNLRLHQSHVGSCAVSSNDAGESDNDNNNNNGQNRGGRGQSGSTEESLSNSSGEEEDHMLSQVKTLAHLIRQAAPRGVDFFFDNVGGVTLDAAILSMNDNGRIAICGTISQYNAHKREVYGLRNMWVVIGKRLRLQGFIVSDFANRCGAILNELRELISSKKIIAHETVVEGFENTIDALIGLSLGTNLGKQVVHVSDYSPSSPASPEKPSTF